MFTGTATRWVTKNGRVVAGLRHFNCNGVAASPTIMSCQRTFHSTRPFQQVSSGSNQKDGQTDPDGFNVDNLDNEAKEKLHSLKDLIVKNSYYEKYKAKIMKAQQSCPMEFLAMLEGLKSSKTKSHVAEYVPKMSQTKKRDLNEVIKVNLLMELEKDDITFIWQEYHRKKNLIAACVPGAVFDKLLLRTEMCPTFVLPLRRKTGHDFHVVQFSNFSFYITPLVSWQAYKENSPATMTVINFDDLKTTKGLVLMRGEYDKNSLTISEAQSLAVQIHMYYAEPDFHRTVMLEKFASEPSAFNHEDLITELNKMEQDQPELFGLSESTEEVK